MKHRWPECSCEKCVAMCEHRPCWPLPSEAEKMLDAGLAPKMMLDYWVGNFHGGYENVELLCGAQIGYEGKKAPRFVGGRCALLENGLCTIHNSGFKPKEGRLAMHDGNGDISVHRSVAKAWDSDYGRAIVARWKEMVSYESPDDDVLGLMDQLLRTVIE